MFVCLEMYVWVISIGIYSFFAFINHIHELHHYLLLLTYTIPLHLSIYLKCSDTQWRILHVHLNIQFILSDRRLKKVIFNVYKWLHWARSRVPRKRHIQATARYWIKFHLIHFICNYSINLIIRFNMNCQMVYLFLICELNAILYK